MRTIELSPDEALVLFEFLARFGDSEAFTIVHPGEKAALWRLEGALEKILVEPFDPAYNILLQGARDRLASQYLGPHTEDSRAQP